MKIFWGCLAWLLVVAVRSLHGQRLDRVAAVVSTTAIVLDVATTAIAVHDGGYREENPLVGHFPTVGRVIGTGAVAVAANLAVGLLLPRKIRAFWWGGVAAFEVQAVGHNLAALGVRVRL